MRFDSVSMGTEVAEVKEPSHQEITMISIRVNRPAYAVCVEVEGLHGCASCMYTRHALSRVMEALRRDLFDTCISRPCYKSY